MRLLFSLQASGVWVYTQRQLRLDHHIYQPRSRKQLLVF